MDKKKETRTVRIEWDTDGVDPESLDLPKEIDIPLCIDKDEIADMLSDEYGYCINSLSCSDEEE